MCVCVYDPKKTKCTTKQRFCLTINDMWSNKNAKKRIYWPWKKNILLVRYRRITPHTHVQGHHYRERCWFLNFFFTKIIVYHYRSRTVWRNKDKQRHRMNKIFLMMIRWPSNDGGEYSWIELFVCLFIYFLFFFSFILITIIIIEIIWLSNDFFPHAKSLYLICTWTFVIIILVNFHFHNLYIQGLWLYKP